MMPFDYDKRDGFKKYCGHKLEENEFALGFEVLLFHFKIVV